ncbi:phosphotransferase [Streptomyces hygroscopicus]|uniref:phosphotransferase n=1 Tax=Streptomyces hygroscopicus TaxID=1912 RepID=UPI0036B703B9
MGQDVQRALALWAPQVLRTASIVRQLRAENYPTPAWLAVGVTAQGFPYEIQEFVPGHPAASVTATAARRLIDLLEHHTGLDPDPGRCWSAYVTGQLTDGGLLCRAAHCGPEGRAMAAECERLLSAHGEVQLPTGDLVHGDFRPANILFAGNRVSGVIDIEAVGSGSRVFDYASLLTAAAARGVAGPAPLAHCLAATALDLTVFVHEHHLGAGIAGLPTLRQRLNELVREAD